MGWSVDYFQNDRHWNDNDRIYRLQLKSVWFKNVLVYENYPKCLGIAFWLNMGVDNEPPFKQHLFNVLCLLPVGYGW